MRLLFVSLHSIEKMPCSHCAREFSLFHREYACPGCGFSHCSSCLKYKVRSSTQALRNNCHILYRQVALPKNGNQEKVCLKCHTSITAPRPARPVSPPKALQHRLQNLQPSGVRKWSYSKEFVTLMGNLGSERAGSRRSEDCRETGKITQGAE